MTRLEQEGARDIVAAQGYLVARSGGENMLAVLPAR
jgi:hypothetical protein